MRNYKLAARQAQLLLFQVNEPAPEELPEIDPRPEMLCFRGQTFALVRHFFELSCQVGRLPSLLGRELFRSRVSHHAIPSFEEQVIFARDVELCLAKLTEDQGEISPWLDCTTSLTTKWRRCCTAPEPKSRSGLPWPSILSARSFCMPVYCRRAARIAGKGRSPAAPFLPMWHCSRNRHQEPPCLTYTKGHSSNLSRRRQVVNRCWHNGAFADGCVPALFFRYPASPEFSRSIDRVSVLARPDNPRLRVTPHSPRSTAIPSADPSAIKFRREDRKGCLVADRKLRPQSSEERAAKSQER